MIILGLNAFHADSSACVIADGRLVAAVEEERFRRVKHFAGFPSRAIEYCLQAAGTDLNGLDVVAVNSDPGANRWRRLARVLTHPPTPAVLADRLRQRRNRGELAAHFRAAFGTGPGTARTVQVEHHRAHLASAFHCSGLRRALVMSVDGFGDFASTAWGVGEGRQVTIRQRVLYPHSLGVFYQAMTQFLGFNAYGDEYKVMGLASYGRPRFRDAMARIVQLREDGGFRIDLDVFCHHRRRLSQDWSDGVPRFPRLFSPAMDARLGIAARESGPLTEAHMDLACSVQERYEDALAHLLRQARARGAPRRLALAGGCAMNSVANGRIYERTDIESVYVQPAAGDAGGALGAALCVHADAGGAMDGLAMRHAAHGPQFTPSQVEAAITHRLEDIREAGCHHQELSGDEELCESTAAAIARVEVVGWFQGRMEWGPRALGHRSIIADPRCAHMQGVLNEKIKRRESFRPFAPSVLREAVAQWFEVDDDVPFMMKVFRVRAGQRSRIPAVTHVDGSGRLQSVEAADQPLFHRLISSFHRITGVPMVLNTSFNENEPIVCTPAEAIDCFLRTRMDRLVLGRHVLHRVSP